MNNIINLLAILGQENTDLSDAEIVELANQNGLSEQETEAIIARDHDAINKLLGARTNVCGLLVPAEDDDDDGDDEGDTESENIAA